MIRSESCGCKLDEFDHVEDTLLDPYSQSTYQPGDSKAYNT